MTSEFVLGIRASVGEGLFRQLPDAFVGVELGCVAREVVQVKARKATTQGADRFPLVDRSVVPDQEDRTSQMPEEVTQELAHLGMLDVLQMETEVESKVTTAWTDRDPGDDGDPVSPLPMVNHRRASTWRPGLVDTRSHEETRLVDEDDVGTQPRGFFLMPDHWPFFQFWMRSSLRSSARRSGF